MVFHPSHRPLEIAHAIPTVPQPRRRRSSLTNKQNKGTLLSSYGRGHFYWALTNPDHAMAHYSLCHYTLAQSGRFDEALAEANRALELDPLSLLINTGLGWCFYSARRYDEAIEQCRKTLELDLEPPWFDWDCFLESYPTYQRLKHSRGS